MFARCCCCFQGPLEEEEETPPAPAPRQQQPQPQQEREDEGFTILTDEELREAVANADSGNGHAVAGEKAGAAEEEWDCIFTDLAVLTFPEGQPEGDPVKVNEYKLDEHLGAGSFGSVRLARRVVPGEGSPTKQYAVKALSKQRLRRMKKSVMAGADGRMVVRTGEDMIRNEIDVMRHLYHRNVVLLFEVISDPAEDTIFMVMEYLEGGPAMAYHKETKRFSSPLTGGVLPEALAAKLFFGLVSGLQYLHARRVCHRDIKPENLLLTEGPKLRISDFGCALKVEGEGEGEGEGGSGSASLEGGLLVDTAGTFTFLAPECCTGEPYSPWPADVWAAAVTLYCFVFGRLPFQRDGVAQLFAVIQEEPMRFPEPTDEEPDPPPPPSPGLAEILQGLFDKDPATRWGLDRVRAHEWLEAPRREDEEEDRKRQEVEAEESAAKKAMVAAGRGKSTQV